MIHDKLTRLLIAVKTELLGDEPQWHTRLIPEDFVSILHPQTRAKLLTIYKCRPVQKVALDQ